MNELKTALSQMKNIRPGLDLVFYQMFKQVPDKIKEYVLKILNKFWMESYFHDCWHEAVQNLVKITANQTITTKLLSLVVYVR